MSLDRRSASKRLIASAPARSASGKNNQRSKNRVAVGKFFTNGPTRVHIAAKPRVGQQLHSCCRPSRIRQQSLCQGLQDVSVPGGIFGDDQNLEAHNAASSQPSESSSETGLFFTMSLKCGTSARAQILDSPVVSSRLQTNVVP